MTRTLTQSCMAVILSFSTCSHTAYTDILTIQLVLFHIR